MSEKLRIPLIPLRGLTVFPNMVLHFDVGREKSVNSIQEVLKTDQMVFLVAQKDIEIDNPVEDEICSVGTVSEIKQIIKISDTTLMVLVEGKYRAKIDDYIENDNYFEVIIDKIEEDNEDLKGDSVLKGYFNTLKDSFLTFVDEAGESTPEMKESIKREENIYSFVDMVSSFLPLDGDKKEEILETIDIKKRIELVLEALENEVKIVKVQKKLAAKMKEKVDDSQKEYYLKEQIKLIQEELGEDDEDAKIVKKYEEKYKKLKAPAAIKEKASYEISRLKGMSVSSSEANTIQTYLDWLFDIPWNKKTKDDLNIDKVHEILDKEHYGLKDVKDRIIEYLCAKKFSGSLKGPILCLVGPPGVGKSTIAKSIAKAVNRKYVRISLGGLKDEAEMRGHRRTYVAAVPGRIVYALKEAKSMNPLILFDEVDKISSSYNGNPQDALLEILDSDQNNEFRDNYMEVPVDLSNVLFITTANSLENVPRPLLDRMEIIEVTGYTYEEKFHIAKDHLINKLLEEYKLDEDKLKITNDAIKLIIDGYTRESGVRSLERALRKIFRKSITEMLKNNKDKINIGVKKVEQYLGKRIFDEDENSKEDKVGVVTGLAWTAYGGDTLSIEAAAMKGTGKLELTGQLGDVMKESAHAAYSYLRANALKYNIKEDFYKNKDIHIHVPEGAVPKDGPSAGVTMVTALVSALSGKKVKGTIAMTGEVTLTGKVLPIGGLKEKSLAAYRSGIKTIIIPKDNTKDVDEIPASIRNKLKIIKAEEVSTVVKNAICGVDDSDN